MRKLVLTSVVALLFAVVAAAPPALAVGTPAGTSISNQAYGDYKDANGNARPRVFSNTVTVTVSQVAAVSTSPATSAQNAVAGTEYAYPVTITNEGNGTDTFNLTASITGTTGTGTPMSTVTIYRDDNNDGIWDPGETTVVTATGVLAADASFKAFAVVTVPPGAANGDTGTITFTATSTFNGTVSDTSTFTTTVLTAVVTVSKYSVDPSSNSTIVTSAKPGDIITFMMTTTNSGGSTAYDLVYNDVIPANTTYVAGSMRAGASASYTTAPNIMTDANDGYEFTAGTAPTTAQVGSYFDSANNKIVLIKTQNPPQGNFYFQVRVNDNVPAGTVISNTWSAEYAQVAGSPTRYTETSNAATVTVDALAGVSLSPTTISKSGNPGDQIVDAFTATNTGNAPDRVDLSKTSLLGWTWVIWHDVDGNGIPGTDGDVILTDTDGSGTIDTGLLPQGGSKALLAVATIPAGLSDGSIDTTVVTGASAIDPTVTSAVTFTTTITAPVLSVTKVLSSVEAPDASVCTPTDPATGAGCTYVPGSIITYRVRADNNGTGNATSVIITDMIPAYTTYQAGSIRTGLNSISLTGRTDASDGDGARFEAGTVIAGSGSSPITLGPSGFLILEFKVGID